ncbi:MAG: hydrolase [Flavihumibacter sp.]|nr:hydrolase [Flavihumibacter sp.]
MSTLNLNRSSFGNIANAGNLLTIQEALALLNKWVPNTRLQLHMKQVAAVMKAWAVEREAADELTAAKWELAGLLHDADWEKYPDQHCRVIIEELEQRNIDADVIQCIASHGPRHFGVQPVSKMDKMIYAIDELSGFIHAAALIRPDRYEGLEVKSVLKRLKTASFAAQVNRDEINEAVTIAGVALEELIDFIIHHQKEVE